MRMKLGLLKRALPAGELPAPQMARQFVEGYTAARATACWEARARYLVPVLDKDSVATALKNLVSDEEWTAAVSRHVEALRHGKIRFFSHLDQELGWPPTFNVDPIHQLPWPTHRHWSTFHQFDPKLSDIKCIWEASRFAFAYLLARQALREGQDWPAAVFWDLFEHWDRQNPYGWTVQWACGQEVSFRLFAWLFATAAFVRIGIQIPAERLQRMTQLVWYAARHVDKNINYARSQNNNHAISEGVALWTVGALFPEFRQSTAWRRKADRILAAEIRRQVYDDGSYVQHSLNYHRVMMDDLLWVIVLSRRAGAPLPPEVQDRFGRAAGWLEQMVDPASGRAPNYGANDGSLVLPLDTCDYLDYRPTVQAARLLLDGRRAFEPGPWDEKALWLLGESVLKSEVQPPARPAATSFAHGGYYILRGTDSWGMIRCHSYRDRPAHADMLHFDLWYRGVNVLRDAGSYLYYCQAPWMHYFPSTAAHNTVEVDGQDQMVKGPRFLWFRWTRSRVRQLDLSSDGRSGRIECEHYGYRRLPGRVVHRRTIGRDGDVWIIADDLLGTGQHEAALRWRLCPAEWRRGDGLWEATVAGTDLAIAVSAPWECQLVAGKENPPEGWESLYYAVKTPAPTLLCRGRADLPIRWITWIGPRRLWPGALERTGKV
jgi:hypothetical protein